MFKFILNRVLLIIPTLLLIILIVYGIMCLTPSTPGRVILGEKADQDAVEQLNEKLGWNRPFLVRYVNYVWDLVHGDLGNSYRSNQPVLKDIMLRLPNTLILTSSAIIIALVVGIPIGVVSAVKQNSVYDMVGTSMSILLAAVPTFWLSLMAIVLLSLKLGWLPSNGLDTAKHFVLPSITLGVAPAASLVRLTRTTMLETIRQDYTRTAYAKGQTPGKVIFRHALKNALLPVITSAGMQFGSIMGSAVVLEQVFAVTGIGTMLTDSIRMKDIPQTMGCSLILSFFFMVIMLLVDISYALIDPRIKARYTKKAG